MTLLNASKIIGCDGIHLREFPRPLKCSRIRRCFPIGNHDDIFFTFFFVPICERRKIFATLPTVAYEEVFYFKQYRKIADSEVLRM